MFTLKIIQVRRAPVRYRLALYYADGSFNRYLHAGSLGRTEIIRLYQEQWDAGYKTDVSDLYLFPSAKVGKKNVLQPFRATCWKCGKWIYFDLDVDGTPGFNGDWGDGKGDYGCAVDTGDDTYDGNGHVPADVEYDRFLYPEGNGAEKKQAKGS